MVEIADITSPVGNFITTITLKVLEFVPTQFLQSPNFAKLVSILVFLVIIYIALYLLKSLKPIVKWAIVIISIFLILSVISTFIQ